jgi:hypothetical protein
MFLKASGGSITVTGNVVRGNSTSGGENEGGHGGGVYAYVIDGTVLVSDNIIARNSTSADSANGGGIYGYAYHGALEVRDNDIIGNSTSASCASGGGVYGYAYHGTVAVHDNVVMGNSIVGGTSDGGGIYAKNDWGTVTVIRNIVIGNSTLQGGHAGGRGGGIYATGGFYGVSVLSNTVKGNTIPAASQGAGVYYSGWADFSYNAIVSNTTASPGLVTGGVAIVGAPEFHHNNLYRNPPYDVVVLSAVDINGSDNFWGTALSAEISARIRDRHDDAFRGELLFAPYLEDISPIGVVPPPLNLQGVVTDSTIVLSWDPIPTTNVVVGYKVHYDSDGAGRPYEGTGIVDGDSPIDVGSTTAFTPSSPIGGLRHIVVTAYDPLARDGWYSNEVNNIQGFAYVPFVIETED